MEQANDPASGLLCDASGKYDVSRQLAAGHVVDDVNVLEESPARLLDAA